MDNRQNGMMTKVWGPPGWFFLHIITFGYPDKITSENADRVKYYADLFNSIGHTLPCKYCRNSYNEYIKELPVENFLDSRESLIKWLYIIHNKVNDKLGVPECDRPTLEEVKDKYEQYRAKCSKTTEFERQQMLSKGCIIPEDGVKKKCLISVVKESEYFEEKFESPCYFILILLYILVITLIIYNLLKALNIL